MFYVLWSGRGRTDTDPLTVTPRSPAIQPFPATTLQPDVETKRTDVSEKSTIGLRLGSWALRRREQLLYEWYVFKWLYFIVKTLGTA
jgi:hypothetical protein